jgi:SAM-dependent methyltransferase
MNLEEYEVMYRVEDTHWWYLGMEQITRQMLDYAFSTDASPSSRRLLDAGCGTGAVMKYLSHYGDAIGLDLSAEALRFSRRRGHRRLTQASATAVPFADATFDLVASFDVLSEIGAGDHVALAEFARVLKPGGRLLLRLPAYKWLRGKHDEAVNLAHRYTTREMRRLLREARLTPVHLSYANTFLFPLAAAKRLSERFIRPNQTGSDLTIDPGPLNAVFRSILSAEAPLVRTTGLPFGLTLIALARKDA